MDSSGKNTGAVTPSKNPQTNRSKISEIPKDSENSNPNLASPGLKKTSKSPATIKSSASKTQKSAPKNPNPVAPSPPRNKIRERRFVVAKRNSKKEKKESTTITSSCKCKENNNRDCGNSKKCLCVAYETLRASQEDFFKNRGVDNGVEEEEIVSGCEKKTEEFDGFSMNGLNVSHPDEIEQSGEMGSSQIKRRREKSVPGSRSGRVMNLVKAFERLLTIPNSRESDVKESEDGAGLQSMVPESQVSSSSSFSPSDFFLTSESLGLDSGNSSSLDSNHGSNSSRTSGGGRRSRRNSLESSDTFGGSRWKKKQLKATSQKPFKLHTEQRGRNKEEEFFKKIQQMMIEEEKQRIPTAQGLPWTTDEPECLVKPPIKEITRPVDLMLHSDVRAVERAEFDQQVAGKMSFIEQYRMERERQRKLAAEEEIKRLRKELVPRAQPMPYFDRPFIPKRSVKNPTIPKEPKFHIPPQQKKIKCRMSWNDMCIHTSNEIIQ